MENDLKNPETAVLRILKTKNGDRYYAEVPSRKGLSQMSIQDNSLFFDKKKANDGDELTIYRVNGQLKRAYLKGHEDFVPPEDTSPKNPQRYGGRGNGGRGNGGWGNGGRGNGGRGNGGRNNYVNNGGNVQSNTQNQITTPLESPSNIGQPFHNPYTFIPFLGTPRHFVPTLRTIDEVEKDRLSGVLELSVQTLRPLLTIQAEKRTDNSGPKSSDVLKIGKDVIVPATAVRGMLRNLMMILTSGSLGNTNPNAWFCCGRDVQLGDGSGRNQNTPQTLFLAKVVCAGNTFQDGIVQIGKCKLVPLSSLERAWNGNLRNYYNNSKGEVYFAFENDKPRPFDNLRDKEEKKTRWQLKLSGNIQCSRNKKEALYADDPTQQPIVIPSPLWADYISRNINGVHPELHAGDLIWLEPQNLEATQITHGNHVKSLQWARWGKRGQAIRDVLPGDAYLPDTRRTDKNVDIVTNLFGQASDTGDKNVPCFAGRIRPENLVFTDAADKIEKKAQLVALSAPHPGCFSFYQKKDKTKLRGYKVYRNSLGGEEPWKYDEQPIYDKKGRKLSFKDASNMTREADLLPPNQEGNLRIAFQALTPSELALLCHVCSVNSWRLGGGKPIGLGLCHPEIKSILILNDKGTFESKTPKDYQLDKNLRETVETQTEIWEATQKPVSKVRYPRAGKTNTDSLQRGGHIWFSTFAVPKKDSGGKKELQTVRITDNFRNAKRLTGSEIEGQWLPDFNKDNPEADILYGWNTKLEPTRSDNVNVYDSFEPFNDESDPLPPDSVHIHVNDSLTHKDRKKAKKLRTNPADNDKSQDSSQGTV